MICFEVSVNGNRLFTAGVPFGVLTAGLDAMTTPAAAAADAGVQSLHLYIGGQTSARGLKEQVYWGRLKPLHVGDQVSIRIIASDRCDEPTWREPAPQE